MSANKIHSAHTHTQIYSSAQAHRKKNQQQSESFKVCALIKNSPRSKSFMVGD